MKDENKTKARLIEELQGMRERLSALEQAQETLSERNQFISSVLHAVPLGVFFKDRDGKYLGCNDAFTEVLGVTSEQIKGRTVFDFWPGELADTYHKMDLELLRSGQHQVYESQVRDKDGRIRPAVIVKDVFLDADGKVAGLVGAFVDISKQKQAEQAWRESEQRYRSLFTRMLDGVYRSTHDGRFVDVNPAMLKMFGYESRDEMLQVDIPNELYFDPSERGSHILDTGEEGIETYRMRRRDGSEIWVEDHGHYVHDEQGNILYHEGLLRDVTGRMQMESALSASEMRNQSIVAALPDLLFHINADLRFIDCRTNNPADLLLPPEQVIGKHLDEILPPELAQQTAEMVAQTLKSGQMQVYEYQLAIQGELQQFETRMTVSGPGAVLALVRNITRRKRTEAALQQLSQDLMTAYDATLAGWSSALELRERETAGHSRRVVQMTIRLARRLGMEEGKLIHVQRGALLHDIGKMGIPDSILLKPGVLDQDEWDIMHQHPLFAQRLLSAIPYLEPALEIPYCHHEHWDGSGYPRHLKEDEIPLGARIFAVIDAWDALLHDRPYRPAWTHAAVVEHLKEQSGKQFDPRVVEAFMDVLSIKDGSRNS